MNPALNKQLHGLLNKSGLSTQKESLVHSYTNGRSISSKDLTNDEAKNMIGYLNGVVNVESFASNKMRRKIISMAHEMHWHLPGTQKIDMVRLNDWCVKFGYMKKELNKHAYKELPTLVFQFEAVYKSYLSDL